MFYFFLLLFSFSPVFLEANVLVNEIAWMGSTRSANDEWIELYNTDSVPVDLSNWVLMSGAGNLNITLSGTIPSNGYFLLERTDDDSALGATADMLYTGSLSNAGDTLTLKNAGGENEDVVSGGENWERIGGDNITKDTAQRTSSGWVTGSPTPRASNVISGTTLTSNTPTPKTTSASNTSVSKASTISTPDITVSAGDDRSVLIGTVVTFSASALGKDRKPIPNASYTWTFGDGASAEGQKVTHQYRVPGEYVVMVNAGNVDTQSTVADRVVVRATDASFTLLLNTDSSLSLVNESEDDVDIGGLTLTGGKKSFLIPPRTIILGSGSIRFVPEVIGFSGDESSMLLYQNGMPVVGAENARNPTRSALVSKKAPPLSSGEEALREKVHTSVVVPEEEANDEKVVEPTPDMKASVEEGLPSKEGGGKGILWILSVLALAGVASAAVLMVRHQEPLVDDAPTLHASDFRIVEED